VLARPALEHPRRRAEAGAGVDQRRAADAAAQRQDDRRVAERRRLAAVAVEAGEHLRRTSAEAVRIVPRALLEDDDLCSALGELGCDDGATCAGADHTHVSA
jgi:hypothetical protein